MLLEAAHLAASLVGAPRGAWAHLPAAVGLWSRGRRCQAAWAPHLRRTRALISQVLATLPSRGCVVVLGSGPLFDLPLRELSEAFGRVVLVDRAHPFSARLLARRFRNVDCVWRDLADSERGLSAFLMGMGDPDWVISLNLLSQLAIAVPDGHAARVVDTHCDALAALSCRVTLVTDTEYRELDAHGRTLAHADLLDGRILPASRHRWTWEVAPFGEESAVRRRVHGVVGYPDWHRARDGGRQKRFIEGRELARTQTEWSRSSAG